MRLTAAALQLTKKRLSKEKSFEFVGGVCDISFTLFFPTPFFTCIYVLGYMRVWVEINIQDKELAWYSYMCAAECLCVRCLRLEGKYLRYVGHRKYNKKAYVCVWCHIVCICISFKGIARIYREKYGKEICATLAPSYLKSIFDY